MSNWTPISEGLPGDDVDCVDVTLLDDDDRPYVCAWVKGSSWKGMSCRGREAIAWQPRPEPYVPPECEPDKPMPKPDIHGLDALIEQVEKILEILRENPGY